LSYLQMFPFDIITSLEFWLNGTVIGFIHCKHSPRWFAVSEVLRETADFAFVRLD